MLRKRLHYWSVSLSRSPELVNLAFCGLLIYGL